MLPASLDVSDGDNCCMLWLCRMTTACTFGGSEHCLTLSPCHLPQASISVACLQPPTWITIARVVEGMSFKER